MRMNKFSKFYTTLLSEKAVRSKSAVFDYGVRSVYFLCQNSVCQHQSDNNWQRYTWISVPVAKWKGRVEHSTTRSYFVHDRGLNDSAGQIMLFKSLAMKEYSYSPLTYGLFLCLDGPICYLTILGMTNFQIRNSRLLISRRKAHRWLTCTIAGAHFQHVDDSKQLNRAQFFQMPEAIDPGEVHSTHALAPHVICHLVRGTRRKVWRFQTRVMWRKHRPSLQSINRDLILLRLNQYPPPRNHDLPWIRIRWGRTVNSIEKQ